MLVAVFALLPLFSSSLGAALPRDNSRRLLSLEARQRGGHRGSNRVRPTGSRSNTQPPASAPAGQSAVAPSPPAATSQPPAAPAPAPAASGQPPAQEQSPVGGASQAQPNPAPSSAAASTAAGATAAQPAGTAGTGSSEATAQTSAGAGTGTGTGGNNGGSAGAGSGPAGTGWDTVYNKADLSTYRAAGLQWWYNWQLQPSVESIVEFVPMVKFGTDVAGLADAMGQWPAGTKYVFSFNEPDMDPAVGGTAMTAVDAAQKHNEAVEILGGNYKISTPGVSRGGFGWMDEWVAACNAIGGCHYDFVAYHYYGTDVNDLINSIKKMHTLYGKEVWLTEWDCHEFSPKTSCSPEQAEAFMKGAIEWFRGEGASIVTRWAWFGAFSDMSNWQGTDNMDGNRIANADGTVNELGKLYLSL